MISPLKRILYLPLRPAGKRHQEHVSRIYPNASTFYNYKEVAMWGLAVVDAISERVTSIGLRSSYNVGACRIMPAVPTNTANVNIHKNSLSSTMATYFQSSFTWNKEIVMRLFRGSHGGELNERVGEKGRVRCWLGGNRVLAFPGPFKLTFAVI